jgi:hypothetical protein
LDVVILTAKVSTFASGRSCLARISDLDNKQNTAPIIIMIHVPAEEELKLKRNPSVHSPTVNFQKQDEAASSTEIYGLQLLSHVVSETRLQKLSKLIIPFVLASGFQHQSDLIQHHGHAAPLLLRFIDAGAVDVFTSPISKDKTESLLSHAYRAFKEVTKSEVQIFSGKHRERKLSWVGVDDEKPFGYLRESMVSNLMLGICSPEMDLEMVGMITSWYVASGAENARSNPAQLTQRLGRRDTCRPQIRRCSRSRHMVVFSARLFRR